MGVQVHAASWGSYFEPDPYSGGTASMHGNRRIAMLRKHNMNLLARA
jgi:hypothetical protein